MTGPLGWGAEASPQLPKSAINDVFHPAQRRALWRARGQLRVGMCPTVHSWLTLLCVYITLCTWTMYPWKCWQLYLGWQFKLASRDSTGSAPPPPTTTESPALYQSTSVTKLGRQWIKRKCTIFETVANGGFEPGLTVILRVRHSTAELPRSMSTRLWACITRVQMPLIILWVLFLARSSGLICFLSVFQVLFLAILLLLLPRVAF